MTFMIGVAGKIMTVSGTYLECALHSLSEDFQQHAVHSRLPIRQDQVKGGL
jgi:hypothetical protein